MGPHRRACRADATRRAGHAPRSDERRGRDRRGGRARNELAHRDPGDERGRGADGAPVPARSGGRGPRWGRGPSSVGRERMSVDRRALEEKGYLVVPGFIDLHAHLREPGFEDSETIATGAHAALRGGFTTICAMPNTDPAIDSPGLVAELISRGRSAGAARVLPIAAITRGRKGRELADLVEL